MSFSYYQRRKLAILCFFSLFTSLAAAPELEPVKPNIIDYKVIAAQHYTKKGYSVLLDTLKDVSFSESKWVVMDDVVIPFGVKMTVPPDVSVFFEPNTSIKVNGDFEAVATPQSPIVFTRIDSSQMLKKPSSNNFTWEGIKVGALGKLRLEHVEVTHVRSGIVSNGVCDSLLIDSVYFSSTLPFTLKTADFSTPIQDDTLFSLRCPTEVGKVGKKTPRFVYWMYGAGAACALSSGIFCTMGYNNDKSVVENQAGENRPKATKQYRVSMWTGIASAGFLLPAFVIQISSRNR